LKKCVPLKYHLTQKGSRPVPNLLMIMTSIATNSKLFLDSLTGCPDYEKAQIIDLLVKAEDGQKSADQIYDECQDKPNSRYFWNAHYCGHGDTDFFARMLTSSRDAADLDARLATQARDNLDQRDSADATSRAMNAQHCADISADIAQAYEKVIATLTPSQG